MRYDKWDSGCASDYVRNEFLVPHIAEFLDHARPESILDIGSLTGYMARTIGSRLSYAPAWTLLDRDAEAIAYSKAKMPSAMKVDFKSAALETWSPCEQFDAVLLTFTLLELDRKLALNKIATLVRQDGHLLLALPDCLQDIIAQATSESSLRVIREFVHSDVELPKIDKFTGRPYPFCASRLTRVISDTIAAGFVLIALLDDTSKSEGVFLLIFQRTNARA